jgi:hypothetical protein
LLRHLGILGALSLSGVAAAPSSAVADEPQAQVIVVHGDGEVRASPDSLGVDVGAESRAATLDQARDQVNRTMTAVTNALKALQIEGLEIQTQVLSVNPIFGPRRGDEPPSISGYAASLHASVTVRRSPVAELGERGSRVLDAALTAGANSVGALEFFLADPSAAEQAALTAAVHAAQTDAETIASAAGVELDGLYSLEESQGMHLVPRSAAPSALASTPVEVQDLVIQSSVTARYAFH